MHWLLAVTMMARCDDSSARVQEMFFKMIGLITRPRIWTIRLRIPVKLGMRCASAHAQTLMRFVERKATPVLLHAARCHQPTVHR